MHAKAWMPSSGPCGERQSCSQPFSENVNKALIPMSGTSTCLGWCHPCPARGQGAGAEAPHLSWSLCGQRWERPCTPAEGEHVCSQICPDLYSASSPRVPLPHADGVGFTLCDSVWRPQEGNSWQNLGSCGAGGRERGMGPGRDTSHEVRSGLGAGNRSWCRGAI